MASRGTSFLTFVILVACVLGNSCLRERERCANNFLPWSFSSVSGDTRGKTWISAIFLSFLMSTWAFFRLHSSLFSIDVATFPVVLILSSLRVTASDSPECRRGSDRDEEMAEPRLAVDGDSWSPKLRFRSFVCCFLEEPERVNWRVYGDYA